MPHRSISSLDLPGNFACSSTYAKGPQNRILERQDSDYTCDMHVVDEYTQKW